MALWNENWKWNQSLNRICTTEIVIYLRAVGYNSTVTALITFNATPQDRRMRKKNVCNVGLSVKTQPNPPNPVDKPMKTFVEETKIKKSTNQQSTWRIITKKLHNIVDFPTLLITSPITKLPNANISSIKTPLLNVDSSSLLTQNCLMIKKFATFWTD